MFITITQIKERLYSTIHPMFDSGVSRNRAETGSAKFLGFPLV